MWLRAVGVLTPDSDGEILEELVAMEVGYQSVEICSMKLSLRSSGRWNLMRKSITEFMQLTKSARTYQQKRLYALYAIHQISMSQRGCFGLPSRCSRIVINYN